MSQGNAAFEKACEIIGSKTKMAEALEITPSFVGQIIAGKRKLPIRYGTEIERLTGVSRKKLFPNTWKSYWSDI